MLISIVICTLVGALIGSVIKIFAVPVGIDANGHTDCSLPIAILVPSIFAGLVLVVFQIWTAVVLGIKRCRDRSHKGSFVILGFIPLLDIWYLVEVAFLPGTHGANRYGPDPLHHADYATPVGAFYSRPLQRTTGVPVLVFCEKLDAFS